jgi:hypothetical protein
MSHKVLWLATIAFGLMVYGLEVQLSRAQTAGPAQTGTGASTNAGTGVAANPVQTIPLGNGLGWSGGTVGFYGGSPAGGALLSTPTLTLESPQPTTGISDAGRAGISDAGRAGISNSNPANESVQGANMMSSSIEPEISAPANPAPLATKSKQPVYDLGPSFFSNEIGSHASRLSLAEVADRYRVLQAKTTLRTYTNADVHPALSTADQENRLLALNKPLVLPQTVAGAPTTSTRPAIAASQQPTGPSAEAAKDLTQSDGPKEMPASASPLPLLGLLGMICIGLGLWLRGSRLGVAQGRWNTR